MIHTQGGVARGTQAAPRQASTVAVVVDEAFLLTLANRAGGHRGEYSCV